MSHTKNSIPVQITNLRHVSNTLIPRSRDNLLRVHESTEDSTESLLQDDSGFYVLQIEYFRKVRASVSTLFLPFYIPQSPVVIFQTTK